MISAMAVQAAMNARHSSGGGDSWLWEWYITRAAWRWMFAIIGWWTIIVLPVVMVALGVIWDALKDLVGLGDD